MRNLTILLSIFVMLVVIWLAGSAGQLFGFADQTSALVVLVLIAILTFANLILISRTNNRLLFKWGGILAYTTFIIGVGFASAYKGYISTPSYMIQSIAIKTKVYDVQGTTGRIETSVQLKILKSDIKDIAWGGLGATGVIRNVTVQDTGGGFKSEVLQEAGLWQLNLHFTEPPQKGKIITFAFEFDVVGSEPEEDTYMVHDIEWPTQNLQITIDVPGERPCKTVEAYSEEVATIGVDKKPEAAPLLFVNSTELQWSKADPQQGRSYKVICHQ